MTLNVVTTSGKNTTLEVNKDVFGATPNARLLAQAVHVYQSNQRQGSSRVKTRGEINRTKKKWYKQKGTGGARHGARTPSVFVGGGVAHGPTGLNDWSRDLSKSQRRKALVYALSLKANEKAVMVSDELESLTAKTKATATFFGKLVGAQDRVLVVLHDGIANVLRSTRNIENVLVTQADRLNVYELLLADKIVMTKAAVKKLEDKLGEMTEKVEKPVVTKTVAVKPAAKVATKQVVKAAAPKAAVKSVVRKPRTVKVK
ncbi:MAG TPA: 50S ribosomal protein L4 [Candidatus Saccharimonadia bacterium]|nr:50S ribosomal protein L4 [Candidatus Saccharimonadia bacterium]